MFFNVLGHAVSQDPVKQVFDNLTPLVDRPPRDSVNKIRGRLSEANELIELVA